MRARFAAALSLALVVAPRLAEACSVCTSGREEENQLAFILTTVFLSLLPLVFIGSVVFWLVRRAREVERLEEGRRHADAPRRPFPLAS